MTAATDTAELTTEGRDPALERWLDEHHVQWVYEADLELDRIDIAKSLANQARIGEPLIDEVVTRYTSDYERGDTFPPLLARRTSARAKLVLLGGNHRRAAAAKAGQTAHRTYIVECPDEAAFALMYGDNRRHGMPPSKAERIRQAVHLIETTGMTQEQAAATVGVAGSEVSVQRKVEQGSRRAGSLGIGTEYDAIRSGQSKVHLARLGSDPVFIETVRLAQGAQLSVSEVEELTKRVRNARSDDAALELLGSESEVLVARLQRTKATGKAKPPVTPYGTLNGAISRILDIHPDQVVAPDVTSAKRMRERLRAALDRMVEVDKVLKA